MSKPDAEPAPDAVPSRSLGLPSATTSVIGSIIGTGVFTIPFYAFLKAEPVELAETVSAPTPSVHPS